MIKIRVPATSANLGTGFDILGLAVSLYATFRIEASTAYQFENVESAYANEKNLFITSYEYALKHLNLPTTKLKLRIDSEVPIARGLGSSATLIVGGLCAAYALHKRPLNRIELLQMASHIEGHPDNVAPAIYGGLKSSTKKEDGTYDVINHPLHPSLHFSFIIPNFELSTHTSRSILPKTYSKEDLDHNTACVELLLKGLETGSFDLIHQGLDDRLHQPYRFPLIQESSLIFEKLQQAGFNDYYLSGAGPTFGLIHTQEIPSSLKSSLYQLRGQWNCLTLAIDTQGVHITYA